MSTPIASACGETCQMITGLWPTTAMGFAVTFLAVALALLVTAKGLGGVGNSLGEFFRGTVSLAVILFIAVCVAAIR